MVCEVTFEFLYGITWGENHKYVSFAFMADGLICQKMAFKY